VAGVTPALARRYRVKWVAGRVGALTDLGPGQAIVTKSFASKHHFHVGSALDLLTVSGGHLRLIATAVASDRADLLDAVNVGPPRAGGGLWPGERRR
jgi:hypothetical protein